MKEAIDSVLWSEAFGYSIMGPATWTDRRYLGDLEGAPGRSGGSMFSGYRKSKDYADGGWDDYSNYTWSDAPQRGARIYGWATLRFLCAINGITPPSRPLKGEPFVPDTRLLVETVWEQVTHGGERNEDKSRADPQDIGESRTGASIDSLSWRARLFWLELEEKHEQAGLLSSRGEVR